MDTELLLLSAVEDDDELLCLSVLCKENNQSTRFDLKSLSNEECSSLFRFEKNDIHRLKEALGIPPIIQGSNRTIALGHEALCILLKRLAYPCRLDDLASFFGRSPLEISIIFNKTLNIIYDRFSHLLHDLDQPWLNMHHIQEYATAIRNKGSPLDNCWGFIDGTTRPICRPSLAQKEAFSGHKRIHCLKYQSIMLPNGLVGNLSGPWEGRRHDAAILNESGILAQLERKNMPNGAPSCIYGDQAYPLRPQLITPYKGVHVTPDQELFNTQMSMSRMSVEWGFNKIVRNFAFLDFKSNLKIFLQPVGKCYCVGSLLTNCHTCLYGSQVSSYFGLNPPSLEEYLG